MRSAKSAGLNGVLVMAIGDLPLFAALKGRLQWHQARQKLLSENVANADSPGFKPQDLKALDFQKLVAGQSGSVDMIRTSSLHLGALGGTGGLESGAGRRFETTPSGNSVNLEDEMLKVAANQMDYQAATSLYAKSLQILKMAVGKRG